MSEIINSLTSFTTSVFFGVWPYLVLAYGIYLYIKGDTPKKKKIGKTIIIVFLGLHILGVVILLIAFGMCLLNLN